ncbi:MAG: hypothetical protein IH960_01110 [Chloroflexi bacterium]|nr:hypothetical protein [Chloroflexota bacterium]MCH8229018.1 hypothetical protein [Chloroflexota bacterium]MCH8909997.1 hypothetical protein [Chloroflexota bacterium]
MSVRTVRKAISGTLNRQSSQISQRGVSGVTIAVMLAALATVTLTIVQAATAGGATAAQVGIPGLIG